MCVYADFTTFVLFLDIERSFPALHVTRKLDAGISVYIFIAGACIADHFYFCIEIAMFSLT